MLDVLVVILFFAYIQLQHRLFVSVPVFGSEIPLLEVALVLVAFAVGIYRIKLVTAALNRGIVFAWLPYLLLGALLPVLGVALNNYNIGSLYACLPAVILPVATVLVGITVFAQNQSRKGILFAAVLNSSIVLQFAISCIQFMRLLGFSNPLIAIITEWDISSQARINEDYVILGRSIGTFMNPNILGVWALIAFFWNLITGKGANRVIFSSLALITLFLSQSRGSAIGFAVGIAFYIFISLFSQQRAESGFRIAITISLFTILSVIAFASLITDISSIPGMERWKAGFQVFSHGAGADSNLAGRVEVWSEAFNFMREYPLGTFGPPQVLFILSPDNHYIHLLLQGSVFFVAAFLVGIVSTAALAFHPAKEAVLLGVLAVALATNSVSALPLYYSPGLLFWLLFGWLLSKPRFAPFRPPQPAGCGSDVVVPRGTAMDDLDVKRRSSGTFQS